MLKIIAPQILQEQINIENMQEYINGLEEDEEVKNIHLVNNEAEMEDYYRKEFSGSMIEKSQFLNCNFEKSSFVDMIFDQCDFSNSNFSGCYWNRCEFRRCKYMGSDFHMASMKHMKIIDCNMQYVNFNGAYLEQVLMDESDLTDAFLSEVKYKKWEAIETKFIGTNFFHTTLRKFDFSQCELAEPIVSDTMNELRGIKITPVQALEIAKLLEIEVL